MEYKGVNTVFKERENIYLEASRSESSMVCGSGTIESFTICISNKGDVYSVGKCDTGAHGHDKQIIVIPTQIRGLKNIKMIDCSTHNSICLDYDGNVFTFGCNKYGQLGIGKDGSKLISSYIPKKVNISACKQVCCGKEFSLCLTEENKVYFFGKGYEEFSGTRECYNKGIIGPYLYNMPKLIPDLCDIEFISCGEYHSICKTYNNEYYSGGGNFYCALGRDNINNCFGFVKCLNWPDNVVDIKCGYKHSLLLTLEGRIYSFGDNYYGQMGLNKDSDSTIDVPTLIPDIPKMQRIECGRYHSMCIDENYNLWVFGLNLKGQLGLGHKENIYKPILHPILSNIMDISSRGWHSFVKTQDNKIYAFGICNTYQLGIEITEKNQIIPIQTFINNENLWCSTIGKSKQKSARK